MRFGLTWIVVIALCASTYARAQNARFEGTVRMVIGSNLILTTGKGDMVIALTPHTRVTALTDASVADLKPGVTVGANTIKGADGKFAATFITIEPSKTK